MILFLFKFIIGIFFVENQTFYLNNLKIVFPISGDGDENIHNGLVHNSHNGLVFHWILFIFKIQRYEQHKCLK